MNFKIFIFVLVLGCSLNSLRAEEDYQRVIRDLHNQHRRKHHVGDLSQSDDLNNRAVQCAQYYTEIGGIDHSCPHKNGAGENLWQGGGEGWSDDAAARSADEGWYGEESQHDYNGDWQPSSGHFTQVVWKGSSEFGFGVLRGNGISVGCGLYSPAGNMMGAFKDNVFPP